MILRVRAMRQTRRQGSTDLLLMGSRTSDGHPKYGWELVIWEREPDDPFGVTFWSEPRFQVSRPL